MKEIFSKTRFQESPGGNIYYFKEADTVFEIERDCKYVIAITTSAKNAAQNNSTDDDDLKVIIDDYEFGEYEVHDEEVFWKGFGTSASLDGDNLKVVVNGKIVQNKKAPISDKYKNFYFSGDLNKGQSEVLNIKPESFEFLEDSVELWYDESPSVYVKIVLFESINSWWDSVHNELIDTYYNVFIWWIILFFQYKKYNYAENFFNNSLGSNPSNLDFTNESNFALKIKKDKEYKNILSLVKREIELGILDCQIKLGKNEQGEGNEINFENVDLFYSLHGLKRIHYKAIPKSDDFYDTEITLIDFYDFKELDYKLNDIYRWWLVFGNNQINKAEAKEKVKIFEIIIQLNDTIKINNA